MKKEKLNCRLQKRTRIEVRCSPRLLLTLRGNRIRWNRSAASATAPTSSGRSAAASGPATSARSTAAALSAAPASSRTTARTRACVPAAPRATPATGRGRARSHATCRRVHAVRVCFAKGIHCRENNQRNHRRQQGVLRCILSRFLSPELFEECFHNKVVDSEKTRTTRLTNYLHSFIALFWGNCNGRHGSTGR
jgi:transposase